VAVEQVIDDLPVCVEGAAVDGVAAGDADGVRAHVWPIFPSQRVTLPGEIECVQHVGPWRDDIHGVADDQRLALVSPSTPVEKVHTGWSEPAFCRVIPARPL